MTEIRIPTCEELIKQIASGPEPRELVGVGSWKDEYRDYLESQKEILVYLLLTGERLSELDRTEIADLLCPELYRQSKKARKPGRPKGTETTLGKDFKIALEYDQLNKKGESESVIVELQKKYGFKDRSSILKAIKRTKRYRQRYNQE